MGYDPHRAFDRVGWHGVVRLLVVLFIASLVATACLFGSVRLGLLDGDALRRQRDVDWDAIQGTGTHGDGAVHHG